MEFLFVYIKEAHPTDGNQAESNIRESVYFRQHQSMEEREEVATACTLDLHISLPVIVDEMNNAVQQAYESAPDRLYVVDSQGRIAYRGGAGPHFFDFEEWDGAIEVCLSRTGVSSRP